MARFSPPGMLSDLTRDEDLQAWSDLVDGALDGVIARLVAAVGADNAQLVNPLRDPIADARPRVIPWLTPPQAVYDSNRLADARTIVDADRMRERQDEYSEWYTHRDPSGNVVAVDVTTELPEYWQFLADTLPRPDFVALYRRYVDAAVTEADLFPGGGPYDPFNPFNTDRGAMHMICGINNLNAALGLIWNATIWRLTGSQPSDVQDCGFAAPHHADPTVIAHFNRLAREGRYITLADPVGVYILGVDTSGWRTPDGSDPRALVEVVRGTPAVRVRVGPPASAFTLSEVTIGGEPIRGGAQVAECVVVGLKAMVGEAGAVRPTRGTSCGSPEPALAVTVAAVAAAAVEWTLTAVELSWRIGRRP